MLPRAVSLCSKGTFCGPGSAEEALRGSELCGSLCLLFENGNQEPTVRYVQLEVCINQGMRCDVRQLGGGLFL